MIPLDVFNLREVGLQRDSCYEMGPRKAVLAAYRVAFHMSLRKTQQTAKNEPAENTGSGPPSGHGKRRSSVEQGTHTAVAMAEYPETHPMAHYLPLLQLAKRPNEAYSSCMSGCNGLWRGKGLFNTANYYWPA